MNRSACAAHYLYQQQEIDKEMEIQMCGPIMDFDYAQALKYLNEGGAVARSGWNGNGVYIALQRPDYKSKMTLPYIYMKTADNHRVPWLASQTDMLASDWKWVGYETTFAAEFDEVRGNSK